MEIPAEARELRQRFWEEQKAKEKKKMDFKKQLEAVKKLRNPCNGRRILEVAQICGCGVVHGGREGTYIVAPDNGVRQPVSVHPVDTSPGMRNSARKFIEAVIQ